MILFSDSNQFIYYFSDQNYAIYAYNLEAPLSPYSSFPSPDSLVNPTTDTLAPSPSSSFTAYSSNSLEPITKRSLALKRGRKSHRRDPTHIRRPRNAFIVFRSAFISAQEKSGTGLQHVLSKQAAFVWNRMSDAQKYTYQETARLEKMLHKIEYPDYQYSPTPKGARARRPTCAAVPYQSVSRLEPSPPVLPERAEFTFSQTGAEAEQPNFLIDTLPLSLEFGTNTPLLGDASGSSEALSNNLDYYPQFQFQFPDQFYPTAPEGGSSVAFDSISQNFEFNPDDYLSNQFLTFV